VTVFIDVTSEPEKGRNSKAGLRLMNASEALVMVGWLVLAMVVVLVWQTGDCRV
jgi:hypothetical protein